MFGGLLPEKSNWYGYIQNNNYEPKTGYFNDLCIAEKFGKKEMEKTLKAIMKYIDVNGGYEAFTELCIVLNCRCWDYWHKEGEESIMGRYYSDLYYEYKDKFYEKYEKNDMATSYFFKMTD